NLLTSQNGHLTQVEVNEMLGLMSHVAAKVPPNDAVPGRVVFLMGQVLIHCSVVPGGSRGETSEPFLFLFYNTVGWRKKKRPAHTFV
uniref:Uncharacterized protein n=1 Tax=Stegastes partitus TaxID=144197 RepID=A0A3B4ZPI1_9TELE